MNPAAQPCDPKHATPQCLDCARWNPHLPKLAECRPRLAVLDATALRWDGGVCPLRIVSNVRLESRRYSASRSVTVQVPA